MRKPETRINLPGIRRLRCEVGTHVATLEAFENSLPTKAVKVVRAWSTSMFAGARFSIEYADGTIHRCQKWGEIGSLFDLFKPSMKSKGAPKTAPAIEPANVVAIADARAVETAPAPAKLLCDRRSAKSPCKEGEILVRKCGCGKVYQRCGAHGGLDGATRSVRSHWTLTGHDWRTGRQVPVEAAPAAAADETPQTARRKRLYASTPRIKAPPVGGAAYLAAFGVAQLPAARPAELAEAFGPVAPEPAPAPSKRPPKAAPAWHAMLRFRAAPRVVARIPGAVQS